MLKKIMLRILSECSFHYALITSRRVSLFRFAQPKEPASLSKYRK
ncbi:MAG: hypothetical protein ACK5KR_02040 [Breznakia sp.]